MIQVKPERVWNQEVLSDIVEAAPNDKKQITYADLVAFVPDVEDQPELLEALLLELSAAGISVAHEEEETDETAPKYPPYEYANIDHLRPDDLLSVYLAEMSQEPLLTHDEEIALGQQIARGRQAEQAIQETDYTAEEYERMQRQIIAGNMARERLGRANTRLVVSIAKRYRGYGISFTDLIQDGNVGLMKAVDRYDHRSGNRFSTYATWWIRQSVTRSLANNGRVIRIPVHMEGRMREMAQVAQRLEMASGNRPTPEEIAEAMNETPTRIREMMRWASRPLSLEQPVGDEGDAELGDFVEDEEELRPEELTEKNQLNDTLGELLKNLTAREARILRLRYGLLDGETHSLSQLSEIFELSRERIRQIEREALAKMRLVAPDFGLQQFLSTG